jgi:hypothetical protein
VDLNCVHKCLSITTAVTNGCGPVVSSRTGRRLRSPPHEQQPRTSHHRANADLYHRVLVFWFCFLYVSNSNTSISMYFFCNLRTHVITLYSGHVCDVLCINTLVSTTHMDSG